MVSELTRGAIDSRHKLCKDFESFYRNKIANFNEQEVEVLGFGEIRKKITSYSKGIDTSKFNDYINPPFKPIEKSPKKETLEKLLNLFLKREEKQMEYLKILEPVKLEGTGSSMKIRDEDDDFRGTYYNFNKKKLDDEIERIQSLPKEKMKENLKIPKINGLKDHAGKEKSKIAEDLKNSLISKFLEFRDDFTEFETKRGEYTKTSNSYEISPVDRKSSNFEQVLLVKIESEREACEQVATIFSKIMDESESRSSESKGGRKYLDPETREVVLIVGD